MRNWTVLIIAAVALSACQKKEFELDIKRDFRADHENPYSAARESAAWIDQGNGLYKATMHIPPSFLLPSKGGGRGGTNDDPFAPTETEFMSAIEAWSAKSTDEMIGKLLPLEFTEGASVNYDYATHQLTMIESPKKIELIKSILGPLCGAFEKQIAVRVEIYEMPRLLAIQLLESASTEGEHTPERTEAMRAVKAKEAKLVGTTSTISRSGQRSRVFGGSQGIVGSDVEESDGESEVVIPFVGTSLEIDPVLGADGFTIDLNIELEHHSEPATTRHSPEKSKRVFENSIVSQVTLHDGNYILIGNWTPDGTRLSSDMEHVVFITGSVQTLGNYG